MNDRRAAVLDTGLKEPIRYTQVEFDQLLLWATDHDVSDVTIQSNNQIYVEQFGRLSPVTRRAIVNSEVTHLAQIIYGDNAPSQLGAGRSAGGGEIDCSYEIKRDRNALARYRVNMTAGRAGRERGIEITIRTNPTTPPPLASLHLPPEIRDKLIFEQGMVLLTGPTGSGKTTLLASTIRELLEQPQSHRKIICYESPIEYVYDGLEHPQALIQQHEIGDHLPTFAAGVRNSLRRKPMVILVGEARDRETIAAAVEAAMTGHLLYSTVHTSSVPITVRRMVNVFAADERESRMMDIMEALQTIITQRLVRTVDGKRAAIREYLHFTSAIKDEILAQPASQAVAATRRMVLDYGRPLTADLEELYRAGRIDQHEYDRFRTTGTQLE